MRGFGVRDLTGHVSRADPLRAFCAASLLLSAVLTAPPAATAQHVPATPTLAEILAHHAQAQGGLERLSSFQTYHARGQVALTGFPLSGTLEIWYARPCRLRQTLDLGIYRTTVGSDGGVPWVCDANNKISAKRDSATVAATLLGCLAQGFDYLLPGGAQIELRGWQPGVDSGGPALLCLRMQGPQGGELDLLIDPQSWLVVETRGLEQGHEVIATYADYRPVDGIPVAFVSEQRVPSLGQTLRITLETARFDEPLPDTLFTIPRGQVRDFLFTGGRGRVTVPIVYADGLLCVDVAVGEHAPVPFVIDSGAGTTVLDSTFAAQLGVTAQASLPGMGGGGVRQAALATLPPLRVADLQLATQTGALLPLTPLIESVTDLPVRGILGYDFLSRFVTRIDYAAQQVTFFDPDSFPRPTGPQAVAVDAPLALNLFTLPVAVEGGCTGAILLDTGATSSRLGRAFAERCGFLERPGRTAVVQGIAGREEDRAIRLAWIEVAGFRVAHPAVSLQTQAAGGFVTGPYIGLLGNNILERFVLTLDYAGQCLIFEAGPFFDHPRPTDKVGLQLARNAAGELVVRGLLNDTPASRAGLREGDVITAIDGRPVAEWGPLYKLREVFRQEAGRVCTLAFVRDGQAETAQIVLEEYF